MNSDYVQHKVLKDGDWELRCFANILLGISLTHTNNLFFMNCHKTHKFIANIKK